MMAEKEQQSPNPLAPSYAYPRSSDTESAAAASHDAREQRKKKRTKCLLYVVLFIVFQTAIITIFALTVMKIRTPKFRVREATLANYNADSSLRATLDAEFTVKNANFGRYKYRSTNVEFFYGDAKVGEVVIPNSKAGWRSTKKVKAAAVELNLSGSPQLSSDLSGGMVRIRSSARMSGRVELMFIMKKNRSTNMNCTMDIVTATQSIGNIVCK